MAVTVAEQIRARVQAQERYMDEMARDPETSRIDSAMAHGRLTALRECQDVAATAPGTIVGLVSAMYADLNSKPYSDAAVKDVEEAIVRDLRAVVPPKLLYRAMLTGLETTAREWMGDQGASNAYIIIRDGGPDFVLPGELLPGDLLVSIVHRDGTDRGEWMVRAGTGENEGKVEFHRG